MTVQYITDLNGSPTAVQVLLSMEEWNSDAVITIPKTGKKPKTKSEKAILNSIQKGFLEVKEHQLGKKKLSTLQNLIDEL